MTGIPQLFYPNHLTPLSLEHQPQDHLDFKVTTPLFYTEVVRFAHLTEFFTTSILTAIPESQTFYGSDPNTFVSLFKPQTHKSRSGKELSACLETRSFTDALRWRFLRWLRNHSRKNPSFIFSPDAAGRTAQDIRSFPFSQLDEFAMQSLDNRMASRYRKAVIKVLASDTLAFGQPALLDALYAIVRIMLCWLFILSVRKFGVLLFFGALGRRDAESSQIGLWGTFELVFGFCGLHLWWGLKESF